MSSEKQLHNALRMLVSVDFSDCCRQALQKVMDFVTGREVEFIVLHVIDQRVVQECILLGLAGENEIKKKLFIDARSKLKSFIKEELPGRMVKPVVCEGIPYMEIIRKAEKFEAEVIVIGSCGMAGNPENIFFGGNAEKVMRFSKCPVFCIPPTDNGRAFSQGKNKTSE